MASKDAADCLTVTWEIENFVYFMSTENNYLNSPVFKIESSKASAWWRFDVDPSDYWLNFYLHPFKIGLLPDRWRCDMTLISSCGEVPLKSFDFNVFSIKRDSITSDNRQSILSNDGKLTILCRMWGETIKTGDICIGTVLRRVNFAWNIERFNSSKDYDKRIEEDSLLFKINLTRNSKQDTHTIELEELIGLGGAVSIVDCKFSIKNHNVEVKHSSYNTMRTIGKYTIVISAGNSPVLNLQVKSIVAIHKGCQDQPAFPSVSKSTNKYAKRSEGQQMHSITLSEDLLNLYVKGLHSDATLNTEGKSFSAHRGILATRSKVFQAMFEKEEMNEGRLGVVDIKDIDSETVNRMLVFLYSDALEDVTWEEAASLYYAADKYAILPLKHKSAEIMKAGLTVDNACDALILADRHSDGELMKSVMDFIVDHQEVISSTYWREFEDSNPRLAAKLIRELFLKKENK